MILSGDWVEDHWPLETMADAGRWVLFHTFPVEDSLKEGWASVSTAGWAAEPWALHGVTGRPPHTHTHSLI